MGELFGTDGVRGVANIGCMKVETVLEIGRAVAHVVRQHPQVGHRPKILIGKDTRLSGYLLENALTAGICSMGVDVELVGPMPTPGIAFLTRSMRADAGVVLSASHNPYQDNGIKIFGNDGFKLPDAVEEEIESLVLEHRLADVRPVETGIGKARRIDDAMGRYIVFCKAAFPEELTLDGLRVVLDCANGATYKVAPIIFQELGAEVVAIHNKPDGTNINERCGSQYTSDLQEKVVETRADIGLAFDGDGDRLIAVDETGAELSGDQLIALCAMHWKELGQLRNQRVVTTIMSNFGLLKAFEEHGIEHHAAGVGDRQVLERMQQEDAVLGGEASGHLIFLEHHTTGDGILAALQVLKVMRQTGRTLSDLASVMQVMPQRMVNVDVVEKPPLEKLDDIQQAIKRAEEALAGQGRVLVRYSGTQSMCRVMVEGTDESLVAACVRDVAEAVRRRLA